MSPARRGPHRSTRACRRLAAPADLPALCASPTSFLLASSVGGVDAARLAERTLEALCAPFAGEEHDAQAAALRGERWVPGAGGGGGGAAEQHGEQRTLAAAFAFAAELFLGAKAHPAAVPARLSAWLARWAPALSPRQSCALRRVATFAAAESEAPAEEREGYWQAVCACAALGWHARALELVGLHSVWEQAHTPEVLARLEALEPVATLLSAAPTLEGTAADADGSGADAAAAAQRRGAHYREAWRAQVSQVLASSRGWTRLAAPEREGLQALLRVLSGDAASLREAAGGGWVDALVAAAVHAWPAPRDAHEVAARAAEDMRAFGEGAAAAAAAGETPEGGARGALEPFLRACAARDGGAALAVASAAFPPALAAHLVEVLAEVGGAEEQSLLARALPGPLGGTLPECLRLQHAAALHAEGSTELATLAEPYLAACPTAGEGARKALAARAFS